MAVWGWYHPTERSAAQSLRWAGVLGLDRGFCHAGLVQNHYGAGRNEVRVGPRGTAGYRLSPVRRCWGRSGLGSEGDWGGRVMAGRFFAALQNDGKGG